MTVFSSTRAQRDPPVFHSCRSTGPLRIPLLPKYGTFPYHLLREDGTLPYTPIKGYGNPPYLPLGRVRDPSVPPLGGYGTLSYPCGGGGRALRPWSPTRRVLQTHLPLRGVFWRLEYLLFLVDFDKVFEEDFIVKRIDMRVTTSCKCFREAKKPILQLSNTIQISP